MSRIRLEQAKAVVMGLCAIFCAVLAARSASGHRTEPAALAAVFLVLMAYFAWKADVFQREEER